MNQLNQLVTKGLYKRVDFVYTSSGPPHNLIWQATYTTVNKQYCGTGMTKSAAKEACAQQLIQDLTDSGKNNSDNDQANHFGEKMSDANKGANHSEFQREMLDANKAESDANKETKFENSSLENKEFNTNVPHIIYGMMPHLWYNHIGMYVEDTADFIALVYIGEEHAVYVFTHYQDLMFYINQVEHINLFFNNVETLKTSYLLYCNNVHVKNCPNLHAYNSDVNTDNSLSSSFRRLSDFASRLSIWAQALS